MAAVIPHLHLPEDVRRLIFEFYVNVQGYTFPWLLALDRLRERSPERKRLMVEFWFRSLWRKKAEPSFTTAFRDLLDVHRFPIRCTIPTYVCANQEKAAIRAATRAGVIAPGFDAAQGDSNHEWDNAWPLGA